MPRLTILTAALAGCLAARTEAQGDRASTESPREVEIAVDAGLAGPGPAVRMWTDRRGVVRGRVTRRRGASAGPSARPLSWEAALRRLDSLGVAEQPPAPPPVAPRADTLPDGRVLPYITARLCSDGGGARVRVVTSRGRETYALDSCGQPAAETARQQAIVRVVYELAASHR